MDTSIVARPDDRLGVLERLEYRLLSAAFRTLPNTMDGAAFSGRSKLRVLLGKDLLERLRGKTVLDFGCGEGTEALELARDYGCRVIGLDIREDLLQLARNRANGADCTFTTRWVEPVDAIVSIDSFEHFDDPRAILGHMHDLLKPGGEVIASFGPTWYHPLGGHLFSVFPWAHLLFSERALCAWRSHFKTDGAARFCEVAGGLNQMTVRRFERLAKDSPFHHVEVECVPIRKLRLVHCRATNEWTTAVVRARLVKQTPS